MNVRTSIVALAVVIGWAASAHAQTAGDPPLGDIARKTEAARPTAKKATKTYTNKDLAAAPETPPPASQTGLISKTTGQQVTADELIKASEAMIEEKRKEENTEELWRMRAGSIRQQVEKLLPQLQQMQGRQKNPNPALEQAEQRQRANLQASIDRLKTQWTKLEASAQEEKIDMAWLEPRPVFPE